MAVQRELKIDLSHVPLRPTSKKEIKLLETALIVATLYRPEIIELIRDPLEKATWLDSLAIAAAALAREKAGYSISQIAEELGRSETTIRAHLQGKTKAGKIVRETYEKLVRGEPTISLPFAVAEEGDECRRELEKLREELKELREENYRLREELEKTREVEDVKQQLEEIREQLEELERERDELAKRVKELEEKAALLDEIRRVLGC
ncbi:transcriptional regulator [Hyperthermus butylicus]|uniref:Conserved archaeal protein n=1 Tax=Hyperthermus butylicus (strain DSM 5456 / JCM 9403 / PLM1-5) TaxID=415426 RepID=A2BM44_HYPBU|nr:transcriptional regulator [Hyperthermus butylicus]ABM81055.1 conserved archaeal protein [Hyperthermus butylicus DSM 5456]